MPDRAALESLLAGIADPRAVCARLGLRPDAWPAELPKLVDAAVLAEIDRRMVDADSRGRTLSRTAAIAAACAALDVPLHAFVKRDVRRRLHSLRASPKAD